MATTKNPSESARRSSSTQRSAGGSGRAPSRSTSRTAVNLPFVTAQIRWAPFRVPEVRLPVTRDDLTGAVAGAASALRSHLPPPQQTAYYAGLGLLGALSLIEWPVAVAIGTGTAIALHGREQSHSDPKTS